jgi:hypothetical protein
LSLASSSGGCPAGPDSVALDEVVPISGVDMSSSCGERGVKSQAWYGV